VQAVGLVLLVAFVALSVEAYFGPGLRTRLLGSVSGDFAHLNGVPPRVFYEPGATARDGQKSVGSEGQERRLLEGDTVLLGETHQLVWLGPGGRTTALPADDGASTSVANLGAWDPATGRLTGTTARAQGGRLRLDDLPLPSLAAALNPPGAPGEALTDGFSIGPDRDAGRVRCVSDRDGSAVGLRASRSVLFFSLDSRQPLTTLDSVLVSISAVVRTAPGKTMMLALRNTIDASGDAESVSDRRPTSDEWTRLTVRRRVVYPSSRDSFSIGIVDADGGDWFEVRDVQVVLGVAP